MKLQKELVEYISKEIIKSLLERRMIEVDEPKDLVIQAVNAAITEELRIEDRLEDEIKEILSTHEQSLDSSGADYRKAFLMIKKKLIRERELIL